jgi:mono/diheme cytochrome c family protein
MRHVVLIAVSLALAACASHKAAPDSNHAASLSRGRELAATHCSSCHAIDRIGDSPFPEAPPFRTLSRNYRVDSLAEALAEGISVGHPAMPEFQFEPGEVNDLVNYLQSIQETPAPAH